MEEQIEKFGSGRKQKRLNNKRQRGQVRNYLKGNRPEDFLEDIDDDYYEDDDNNDEDDHYDDDDD